jgi:hypothetical protein
MGDATGDWSCHKIPIKCDWVRDCELVPEVAVVIVDQPSGGENFRKHKEVSFFNLDRDLPIQKIQAKVTAPK